MNHIEPTRGVIECALSGRSTCRTCREKIHDGHIKHAWYHLHCISIKEVRRRLKIIEDDDISWLTQPNKINIKKQTQIENWILGTMEIKVKSGSRMISHDGESSFEVSFEYNPEVLDIFKNTVRPSERSWMPDPKLWLVKDTEKTSIEKLVAQHKFELSAKAKMFLYGTADNTPVSPLKLIENKNNSNNITTSTLDDENDDKVDNNEIKNNNKINNSNNTPTKVNPANTNNNSNKNNDNNNTNSPAKRKLENNFSPTDSPKKLKQTSLANFFKKS